nr:MAG TPA: hypothetical protein [Caudoviricetes sp.]
MSRQYMPLIIYLPWMITFRMYQFYNLIPH